MNARQNQLEQDIRAGLRDYGLYILDVLADRRSDDPVSRCGYTYTIGRARQDAPELVLVGLGGNVGQKILALAVEQPTALEHGLPVRGLIMGHLIEPRQMHAGHIRDRLTWAHRMNGRRDVHALQLVWPDRIGTFPWEDAYTPSPPQPLLTMSEVT